jgi:hypothetical protein
MLYNLDWRMRDKTSNTVCIETVLIPLKLSFRNMGDPLEIDKIKVAWRRLYDTCGLSERLPLLHLSLCQVEVEVSAEAGGGCMNAAKHSFVQEVDKTLKAQNSAPSSVYAVPAIAGPKSQLSICSLKRVGRKVVIVTTYRLA